MKHSPLLVLQTSIELKQLSHQS